MSCLEGGTRAQKYHDGRRVRLTGEGMTGRLWQAWPFLLGSYCEASLRVGMEGGDKELRAAQVEPSPDLMDE